MAIYWDYENLKNTEWTFAIHKKGKKNAKECQNIITFDIETSNGFLVDGKVRKYLHNVSEYESAKGFSIMYVWQVAIENGNDIDVYLGRTWEEYIDFMDRLSTYITAASYAGTSSHVNYKDAKSILKIAKQEYPEFRIYVHNLSFEFQFLRNLYEKAFSRSSYNVFARKARTPMKACMSLNGSRISYCDTYALTQKKLSDWGNDEKLEVRKLIEPDDYYDDVRTPLTPLTENEIQYSVNDVVTMVYGLRKYRDKYNHLYNIPMTQTGTVRRIFESEIAQKNVEWNSQCLKVTESYDFKTFSDLVDCFVGGWTHANALHTDKLIMNVLAYDFASSYPSVMCNSKFPIGVFEPTDSDTIERIMLQPIDNRTHNFYIKVKVYNITTNQGNTFWSSSKTKKLVNAEFDNGKIFSADEVEMVLTDLDWDVFTKAYYIESYEITEAYIAESDYLPRDFIKLILHYYHAKTAYKGVKGKESQYVEAKQIINAIYGMCVLKQFADAISFVNGWNKEELTEDIFAENMESSIRREMTNAKMFTTYQIGVWITAWARHNLWDGILHLGDRVAYGDTDSLKGLFTKEDEQWFEDYNENVVKARNLRVCEARDLNIEDFSPLAKDGTPSSLGYFDRESDCVEFKTLGAKRYAYKYLGKDGKENVKVVVAGLPKSAGPKMIKEVSDFNDDVTWGTEDSGKLTAYYQDSQSPLVWVDRDGVEYVSGQYDIYGVCLKPTTFVLGITDEYSNFFTRLQGDVAGNIDTFGECFRKTS